MNELDIIHYARGLPHFKGIFMRNDLPKKCLKNECAVINLDDLNGPGTHWVAYLKKERDVYYFDSFGNLPPPVELIQYLGSDSNIYYNYKQYQRFGTVNCGHLCLSFLFDMTQKFIKNGKYLKKKQLTKRNS